MTGDHEEEHSLESYLASSLHVLLEPLGVRTRLANLVLDTYFIGCV